MRDYSAKRLLLCLALICGFSGLLQVLVFRKRQDLHFKHYADARDAKTPAENSTPASAMMDGKVAALGMDRIHLNYGSALIPIRCDSPGQYKVGELLRVTYTPGQPAVALKIERLP